MDLILLLALITFAEARMFCEKEKIPLERGHWQHNLLHMDSAVVENQPVSISEGQIYVYENYFPGYTIRYIYVDNVAMKSCGASATIKSGGIGTTSVLIVLHAGANQEIRSVVDIWGTKDYEHNTMPSKRKSEAKIKNLKSLYLFKDNRAVNHNGGHNLR